jgi:hypothetical protein
LTCFGITAVPGIEKLVFDFISSFKIEISFLIVSIAFSEQPFLIESHSLNSNNTTACIKSDKSISVFFRIKGKRKSIALILFVVMIDTKDEAFL